MPSVRWDPMRDAVPPGIQPLIETVERLWPEASGVELLRGRGGRSSRPAGAWDLLAVPDVDHPRVLLPSPGRAAAAGMQRFSAAIGTREVLQRQVSGLGFALGGTRLLGGGVRIVDPGTDHIVALVEGVVGRPVTVSLGIGSARANRKPVLGVFDRAGRPVAFAKVGDSPVAVGHVLGEVDALRQVGERTWSVVEPPRLLAHRTWRTNEVLVMTALRPRAWRGRGVWPVPVDAADEVSRAFDGGTMALDATPMWRRCLAAASELTDERSRSELVAAMDRVAEVVGDRPVDTGGFHGDFTPWNLARRGDRVLLWDWERFETGVPRGLDRLHYSVNTVVREHGASTERILEGLRSGATAGAEHPEHERVLALAYLTSLSCRYLTAAQGDGGEVIRPRAEATLAALTRLSEDLVPHRPSRGAR